MNRVCCFVLLNRYWGIVTVPGSIIAGPVVSGEKVEGICCWLLSLVKRWKEFVPGRSDAKIMFDLCSDTESAKMIKALQEVVDSLERAPTHRRPAQPACCI